VQFIDSLTSIVERTASVYPASDYVGLEICARKLDEHPRMLIAISLSQNSSLGDLFEVLEVSLAMLLKNTSDILHASNVRPIKKTDSRRHRENVGLRQKSPY